MGEAISSNNDRVLWDEVRKISKSSHDLPSMMDGIAGTEEIANIFGNKQFWHDAILLFWTPGNEVYGYAGILVAIIGFDLIKPADGWG